MTQRHRPATIAVICLVIAAAIGITPARAESGATLRSKTVLPDQPPIGGVVRLDLDVANDSGKGWSAKDSVRLRWAGPDGKTALEDLQPLSHDVPGGSTVRLTLVTLAPAAVGDFTLSAAVMSHGQTLAIGDPMPYHLSGFLFKGRGNGHGLGMSQWGARGRNQAGQDYRAILQAYYQGTAIDRRDTSATVRIALTHGAVDLASPWARLFGPFPEIAGPASVDGRSLSVAAGGFLVFGANARGQPTVLAQSPDGRRGAPIAIAQPLTVRTASAAGLRTNLLESLDSDFRTGSEERRYGGTLTIIPRGGARIQPVNALPLEDYLRGVVPAEMPFSWGDEALKAQAVAARTYALRKIALGGHGDYDLEGNEFDQAYSGLSGQRAASTEAVDATRGLVLTSGGHLIDALYMASGGGHTENSEYGFIRWDHGLKPAATYSYLRGIVDPEDHAPAWQVGPITPEAAASSLRDNGDDVGDRVLGIDVLQKGPSGRALGLRIRGSSQTIEISGPYLRYLYGLPDTLVEIVGGA